MKTKGKEAPKPLRFLQKIEKPIPRPPTPSVEVPDRGEEEKELAIIFLQQVIRGRAIQNMVSFLLCECSHSSCSQYSAPPSICPEEAILEPGSQITHTISFTKGYFLGYNT